MTVVTNTERRPDGTAWAYGEVDIGLVGAGFDGAGGQVIGVAKGLTDGAGAISFTLAPNATGEFYVWTGPDRRQYQFGPVPATGGPYTLQTLLIAGATDPGVPAASAAALAALAAIVSGLGAGSTPTDNLDGTWTESTITGYTKTGIETYIAGKVAGLLNLRSASYNASSNAFPSSGGSGTAGAIKKGDLWIIGTGGTLGGTAVTPGDVVWAVVDTPGSTAANWEIVDHDVIAGTTIGGLPSYAPTSPAADRGLYNPDTCSYGLTQDQMAGARIAAAKAESNSGTFDHLHLGDSVSAEYMGSDVTAPNDPANSWVMVQRDIMLGSGLQWGGTGYVCPGQNFDPTKAGDDQDPRWTLSSGWNSHNYGVWAQATAAGETAKFEVPAQYPGGTHVSWVVDDAFADLTYVVKDSTGATIASGSNGAAGTNTIRLKTLNLTDIRSITFTSPAGTNSTSNKARIYPANIYLDSGYRVHNFSFVGALMTSASGFENTSNIYNWPDKVALLCVPNPDLLTMLGGGNDIFNGLAPGNNMSAIVAGIPNVFAKWGANAKSKIFLGHSQASSWSTAQMAIFTAAYWGMCITAGLGFIDTYGFSGGYTLMNAMGIMQDSTGGQTHPTKAFGKMLGRLFARILMPAATRQSIQDIAESLAVAGTNVSLVWDAVKRQLTINSAGGGGGGGVGFTAAPDWVASHAYTAGDFVKLPTGGIGYRITTSSSNATFDAAERDAWHFIQGGHYEKLTVTGAGTWKCPVGVTQAEFKLKGAGGSGGGGGSSATATNQAGGGGGGACAPLEFDAAVTAGTSYVTSIAAATTGGPGGAAGGNNGTTGTSGGDTTIIIGATTYTSKGGGAGTRSTANSTSAANGGLYGFPGGSQATGAFYPGAGGPSGATPIGGIPLGEMVGGGGAANANGAGGGNGGGARTAPGAAVAAGSGVNGTAAGAAGTTATEYGCGGGGGGGGTNNTGAGAAGGGGAQGVIEVWF